MNEAAITERLVQFGKDRRDVRVFDESCGVPEADALVNNLKEFPHAFVLACLMDRQGGWKKAWQVPYRMAQRLGEFSMAALSGLSLERITELMSQPDKRRWVRGAPGRSLFWAVTSGYGFSQSPPSFLLSSFWHSNCIHIQ